MNIGKESLEETLALMRSDARLCLQISHSIGNILKGSTRISFELESILPTLVENKWEGMSGIAVRTICRCEYCQVFADVNIVRP